MSEAATLAALLLPAPVAVQLRDHARRQLPNEACGLLSGDPATNAVLAYHPARNEHGSPYRFSLDPRDLVRIIFAIEAAGQQLLAIFHSHPRSAARPSATDVRETRYPEAMHLLAGPDGELRAWRIADGTAVEMPVRIG